MACATVLLAVALGLAADLKVDQNPVPAHSFAVVTLAGAAPGASVVYDVDPEPAKLVEDGGKLYLSGPPGASYRVTADVIDWEKRARQRYRVVVRVGDKVEPKPEPIPDPKPKPEPGGKVARFVVVEDTARAGGWRGQVLGSPKVAALYKAQGLTHRLVDVNADGDDATALEYKRLAAGKTLPRVWLLDAAGKVIREQDCPTDPDAFAALFDPQPGARALGAKLEKPKLKWKTFGSAPSVPLIPRDQWRPVDLSTFLPPVYDQDGIGQCASSAACTVVEACRAQAGLRAVHLSAGDLYSRVNGGRDQGSLPEDNLDELVRNGVAPAAAVPYVWDRRQRGDPATVQARRPYRIDEAYLCESFEAMASALQQGFVIVEAIWWHDNDRPDADGWLPARGAGSRGGHALCGYGLAQRNGVWGVLTRNSWSAAWGKGGDCVIPESRFSFEFGAVWACRSVAQTQAAGRRRPDPRDRLDLLALKG